MDRIYLDHNATSFVDAVVEEAMRPHWHACGNPESRHSFGRAARRAWEEAKATVAECLGATPVEVVFTSGGTEANNAAINGLAGERPCHIITSSIEHPAVAEPLAWLGERGWSVDCLGVDAAGVAIVGDAVNLVRPETKLATLMLANNETGAIQPVDALVAAVSSAGIPVHTDAAQAIGRIPIDFHALGVATLAASAHKMGGPSGIGVLLIREGTRIEPLLRGGGQQRGKRAGTPPVALAVGFAKALEIWRRESTERTERWRRLRKRFEDALIESLGRENVVRNGPANNDACLPQTINLGFPGLDGDALLMQLDLAGVAASLGSACSSGSTKPSPALVAMGVPADRVRSSARFSFGPETTDAMIDEAARRVGELVRRIRAVAVFGAT